MFPKLYKQKKKPKEDDGEEELSDESEGSLVSE